MGKCFVCQSETIKGLKIKNKPNEPPFIEIFLCPVCYDICKKKYPKIFSF